MLNIIAKKYNDEEYKNLPNNMADYSILFRYRWYLEKKAKEEIKTSKINDLVFNGKVKPIYLLKKKRPLLQGAFLKYFFNNMGMVLKS